MPDAQAPADTPPADPTWVLLKDAVADALDLDPERWPDALAQALKGDTKLIDQATDMLRAATGSTAHLNAEIDAIVGNDGPDPYTLIGQEVGGYTVERLIAEGGMGAVYAAKQERPARTVALKVLRPGSMADTTRMRFGREVTALGRLKHLNIAQIYDAGVHRPAAGTKLPYLVMEYVDGPSLTGYARKKELPLPDKLRLLAKVADAVHAAHQQAIIHRDLKPANILVDADGEPKVLDFGIARFADEDPLDATSHTATGTLLGTLAYMSPEQVAGQATTADARADVYALGVILHELILGRPPVDVRNQPLPVAIQRITEDRTIELGVGFPADLETIVATALENDPDRRYGAASELAADLRRFLGNDPIAARPPTTGYLLSKFAQRHRGPLFAAAGVVVLLIAATVLASVGFVRAETQRRAAEVARNDAQEQRAAAVTASEEAVRQRNLAQVKEEEAIAARDEARGQRVVAEQQRRAAVDAREEADRERDNALTEQQRAEAINRFLFNMLAAPDPEILGRDITVLETIDAYIAAVDDLFVDQPHTRGSIYSTLGWVYFALGEYDKAEPTLLKAIDIFEQETGPYSQETLAAVGHLASIYDGRGEYNKLADLLDDTLPGAIEARGKGNDTVLHMQGMLAAVYDHQGRYREADALFAQTIETARDALGPEYDLTLTLMNNYGSFLVEQGEYDRAQPLLEAVVKFRENDPMTSQLDLSVTLSNLAGTFIAEGRYDEADAIFSQATQVLVDTLGERHDTTLSLMMAHVSALKALGRMDEATALSEKVVRIRLETLGPDHEDTLRAMNNHAVQLGYAERFEEGVEYAEQAYRGMRAIHGSGHPLVWQVEQNLATNLSGAGRNAEAQPLLEAARERLRVTHGESHPETLVQANNLAMCLFSQERYAEALVMLEECIELGADTLPGPYLAAFYRNAGRSAAGAEQYEVAERHLLTSYEMLRDEPGGASRARTARFLVELYEAWGKPDEAVPFRDEAEPADAP